MNVVGGGIEMDGLPPVRTNDMMVMRMEEKRGDLKIGSPP